MSDATTPKTEIDVKMVVIVDSNGDCEFGNDVDEAMTRFTENIGTPVPPMRVLSYVTRVSLPERTLINVTVGPEPAGTVKVSVSG